jgi:hypothetical protein
MCVHSDHITAVSIINKGSCRNVVVMDALRDIFWASAVHNFRLKAIYYPGRFNTIADRASRLHEVGGMNKLLAVLVCIFSVNLF